MFELSSSEVDCVSGACNNLYDCSVAAGRWVANRIEDAAEAVVDAAEAYGEARASST